MDPISENPYAAPQTFGTLPDHPSPAQQIRKAHLNTEACIRATGFFYNLGGGFALLMGALPFVTEATAGRGPQVATDLLLIALGIALFIVGAGIRRLKPWSGVAAGILSGIGLLGFPLGTLVCACMLYLTFGQKGKMVISEPFKTVIAETPHIKYRTFMAIWVTAGLTALVVESIFLGYVLS